jgi:hypothetical protein
MRRRHRERTPGRVTATIAGALGLALGSATLSLGGPPGVAAAAVAVGSAEIIVPPRGAALASGGSATEFGIGLPLGSACTGDSPNAGYRLQSFLVPQSVAPDSLRFDSSGPVAAAGEFRAPLFQIDTVPFVDQQTAAAVPVGGPGPVIQPLPAFSFAVYDTVAFPVTPGAYRIGIACTLGPPSATQLDRLWEAAMTITADPSDAGPAKIRWVATALPAATTTSSVASTTSSSIPASMGSSTTTATTSLGSTTSSSLGSTSTSSSLLLATGSAASAGGTGTGGGSAVSAAGGAGELPRSGNSALTLVVWAALLVYFGRVGVLLGRRPKPVADQR